MIDAKKVQIMTRLAVFEQREEAQALQITKYERLDFVRIQLLKMILSVTTGYGILVMFLGFYHLEYILEHIATGELTDWIWRGVAGYVGLLIFYALIGVVAYHIRYRRARRRVKEYDRMLHALRKYYRRKEQELEQKGRVVRRQPKR